VRHIVENALLAELKLQSSFMQPKYCKTSVLRAALRGSIGRGILRTSRVSPNSIWLY